MFGCDAIDGDIVHLRYLECIFYRTLLEILPFAAIVVFVVLLLGGFKYLTSGDNPKSLEGARKTITYAIFGLVALLLVAFILFVIANFTGLGSNLTTFRVYKP